MADVNSNTLVDGGGLPINSVLPFNFFDAAVEQGGQTWLKSGTIETDTASYPDATVAFGASGVTFDTSAEDTVAQGIAWDGTHFWVCGSANNRVYKYTTAGVYTGVSFLVTGQGTDPQGVTWTGSSFWVAMGSTDTLFQYDASGVYTGVSSSGQVISQLVDVAWDGTSLWAVDGGVSGLVYQFDSLGVATGSSFDHGVPAPRGITWDGTHFWICDGQSPATPARTYKYTAGGVYTGNNFIMTSNDTGASGIAWDGASMWVITLGELAFEYVQSVGLSSASFDADTGLPIYVRVK